MNYLDQLKPWVVYRLLPNCQRLLMERFRKRNDAEAYLRVIQQMQTNTRFEIVFEVEPTSDRPTPNAINQKLEVLRE